MNQEEMVVFRRRPHTFQTFANNNNSEQSSTRSGASPDDENSNDDHDDQSRRRKSQQQQQKPQEPPKLEQTLRYLLLAAEDAEKSSQQQQISSSSSPINIIPDLTVFQKQVTKNAAAGSKMTSPFAKLSALDDDNDDDNNPRMNESSSSSSSSQYNSLDPNLVLSGKDERTTNNYNYSSSNPTTRTIIAAIEGDNDNDEGFYLAPDIYERSRDLLNTDGSLDLADTPPLADNSSNNNNNAGGIMDMKSILENLLTSTLESSQQGAPPLMDSSSSSSSDQEEEKLEDWDAIWAAIQTQKSKAFNASQSEELHRRVFENEQGYWNQSQSFRLGLTDPTIAANVAHERRSAKFRDRQAKAVERLNQQMEAFVPLLLARERPGPKACSRCRCKLVDSDFDIVPQLWMRQQNLTTLCGTCYKILFKTPPDLLAKRSAAAATPAAPLTTKTPPSVTNPSSSTMPRLSIETASANSKEASSSSAWAEVEDPETGEVFYYNEETDEVRWEKE